MTDTLVMEEGESVSLASWIVFHSLRTWAEECIARANIKKSVRRENVIFLLENRPNTDIIGDSK